jgi:hypothetical protein
MNKRGIIMCETRYPCPDRINSVGQAAFVGMTDKLALMFEIN